MSFEIRRAVADDMPAVWDLIRELAEFERLAHAVTGSAERLTAGLDRDFECFVLEQGQRLVAYALCFRTYSTFRAQAGLWLEDLYVTPERRGQGLGKAMLRHLIDEARSRGYGRLEWSVLDWNESAIGFYRAMGATLLEEWRICRIEY